MSASDAAGITYGFLLYGLCHDIDGHRAGGVAFGAFDAARFAGGDLLPGGAREEAERGSERADIAVTAADESDPEEHHEQEFSREVFVGLGLGQKVDGIGKENAGK